jgi:hypothetical protein
MKIDNNIETKNNQWTFNDISVGLLHFIIMVMKLPFVIQTFSLERTFLLITLPYTNQLAFRAI